MEFLVGGIAAILAIIVAAQFWIYRPSALPAALENQKKAEIARDEAIAADTQHTKERDQARREATEATRRAEVAERALHDQLKRHLPHLPGAALLGELARLLQEAGAVAPAPVGGGPGDPDSGGVQPPAGTIRDPFTDVP